MPGPQVTASAVGTHPERALASAAVGLTWEAVPAAAQAAIRRLFLDWMGSALAGSPSAQVTMLQSVASSQGALQWAAPSGERRPAGTSTVVTDFSAVAPLCAALVNAAASHVVEMDDLHNSSIYHPGTCVFPALLATAEAAAATPDRFFAAAVAGYEVSIRIGEALGPEHYMYFHTTGTAGTFGAAVAVGHLLGLGVQQMLWAMGNAATQAAGLWQFLAEGSMSKQLHTAKAAFNGALAAYLAAVGFTGPEHGLVGDRAFLPATTPAGALSAHSGYDADLMRDQRERLVADMEFGDRGDSDGGDHDGGRPATFTAFRTPTVSFKYHASCRHTHPAVDALVGLIRQHDLRADDLQTVDAYLYTGAYERLKDVAPTSPWAAKFNLPFCLAQAALHQHLTLDAFSEAALGDPQVLGLMDRVTLHIDPELDRFFPRFWPARVVVRTTGGAVHEYRIDTPKGDPENPVTDEELDEKFLSLASLAVDPGQAELLLSRLRSLDTLRDMTGLLAGISGPGRPTPTTPAA